MVVDILLLMFSSFLSFVFSFLPSASYFPDEVASSFSSFAFYFGKLNSVFPVDSFFVILGLIISVESVIFLFNVFNWVLNKIRGSG